MIKVTRLNKEEIFLNADFIESLEATPDTIISLFNGKKIMVREKVEEVVARVLQYKKTVGRELTVIRRPGQGDGEGASPVKNV